MQNTAKPSPSGRVKQVLHWATSPVWFTLTALGVMLDLLGASLEIAGQKLRDLTT